MTVKSRIAVAAGYAIALGAHTYITVREVSLPAGLDEAVGSSAALIAIWLALPLVVGAAVRRYWVVLTMVGPLLALIYLEAIGYVGPWSESLPPISVVSLSFLGVEALLLWSGALLGAVWEMWRNREQGSLREPG